MMKRATLLLTIFAACSLTAMAEPRIGEAAPDFTLKDIDGHEHKLADFKGKFVVLEWTNPDCPFVKKHYNSGNMQKLQKTYTEKGVAWLSVNSSAPGKQGNYPADQWKKIVEEKGAVPTALLLDPDGTAGHAFDARTTPHMYVIDPEGLLIYMGAIDDKASTDAADIEGSLNYVVQALDESMAGKPVSKNASKPYGCGVKY